MKGFNLQLYVTLAMWALPVGVAILLIVLITMDIIEGRKTKLQLKRFEELYKKCIEMHGLPFANKLYDCCRHPLWIGLEKTIAVFEHHCGIQNDLSQNL
jgi:hypothetical protein